jgi:hypothetical protein
MAKLVADKQTEAVVRVANRTRQAKVDKANAAAVAAAPLLAWGGLVEQQPPPVVETVEDRLDLRRRVIVGTYNTMIKRAQCDAQMQASARWYAYLDLRAVHGPLASALRGHPWQNNLEEHARRNRFVIQARARRHDVNRQRFADLQRLQHHLGALVE